MTLQLHDSPGDDDDDDDDASHRTYVVFLLGSERYALPVQSVGELVRVPEIIAVPDVPPYVCGAVNLRGNVLPVVDLRVRFGMPRLERNSRQVLIVTAGDEEKAALLVDAVIDAAEIPDADIDQTSVGAESGERGCVRGLAKRSGGQLEIVLNVGAILTHDRGGAP